MAQHFWRLKTCFQVTQRVIEWQLHFAGEVKYRVSTEDKHSELDGKMISQIHCSNQCVDDGVCEYQNEHDTVINVYMTSRFGFCA